MSTPGYVTLPGTDEFVELTPNVSIGSGVLEIIVYLRMADWTPSTTSVMVSVWGGTSAPNKQGFMVKATSTAVQAQAGETDASSTLWNWPQSEWTDGVGRWVRWVINPSTGNASMYTSTDDETTDVESVSWSLVSTQSASPFTLNNPTTATVHVGCRVNSSNVETEFTDMEISYVRVTRDGGTTVCEGDWRSGADFDGSDQRPDDYNGSNTWTLNGTAPTYTTEVSDSIDIHEDADIGLVIGSDPSYQVDEHFTAQTGLVMGSDSSYRVDLHYSADVGLLLSPSETTDWSTVARVGLELGISVSENISVGVGDNSSMALLGVGK
jgi:hypothetical protein